MLLVIGSIGLLILLRSKKNTPHYSVGESVFLGGSDWDVIDVIEWKDVTTMYGKTWSPQYWYRLKNESQWVSEQQLDSVNISGPA